MIYTQVSQALHARSDTCPNKSTAISYGTVQATAVGKQTITVHILYLSMTGTPVLCCITRWLQHSDVVGTTKQEAVTDTSLTEGNVSLRLW